jgi:hypothetical protein
MSFRERQFLIYIIKRWLNMKNNINFNLAKVKQIDRLDLSYRCRSIILGSLLGDGTLRIDKGYKNSRFKMRHSIKNKDYFDWKATIIDEIATPGSVQISAPDGFSKLSKISFTSSALVSLTGLFNICYKRNILNIKRKWLNKLNEESLLVWWLDDGSLVSNGRKGVFCTDAFSMKSLRLLSKYLYRVWGISVTISPVKKFYNGVSRQYFRLWLNNSELRKFLILIAPFVPTRSVLYKFLIRYNDLKTQQRWISDINLRLPEGFKLSENDIVQK